MFCSAGDTERRRNVESPVATRTPRPVTEPGEGRVRPAGTISAARFPDIWTSQVFYPSNFLSLPSLSVQRTPT